MIKPRTANQTLRSVKVARTKVTTTIRNVERTRQQILDSALTEFASNGFSGTRIATIAQKAKVNKQALYYHFGSKKQLYQNVLKGGYSAIYQKISDRLTQVELDEATPPAAVRLMLQIYFDTMLESKKMLDIIANENRHKGSNLKELPSIRMIAQPFFVTLKSALKRGEVDGSFRKGLDPVHTWIAMISLCQFWWTHRYTLSHILARDIATLGMVRERREQIVEFVLSALAPSIQAATVSNPAGMLISNTSQLSK